MSKKIVSPCISICKTDPITGFCYGCARTEQEKKLWKDGEEKKSGKKKHVLLVGDNFHFARRRQFSLATVPWAPSGYRRGHWGLGLMGPQRLSPQTMGAGPHGPLAAIARDLGAGPHGPLAAIARDQGALPQSAQRLGRASVLGPEGRKILSQNLIT